MIQGLYRNRKYAIGDKIIVMSFPGMGKTEAVKKHPDIFIEVDGSDYCWDNNPNSIDFPKNYVDKIEEILEDDSIKAKIILICNHAEVMRVLRNRNIKFCSIIINQPMLMISLRRAKYKPHLVEYFSDIYKDLISLTYELCNGSILFTGCDKIETLFLGHHWDLETTYKHIIYTFNSFSKKDGII